MSVLLAITPERKLVPIRIMNHKIPHAVHPVSRFAGRLCARDFDFPMILVHLIAYNIGISAANARPRIIRRSNMQLASPHFETDIGAISKRLRKPEHFRIKPHRSIHIAHMKNGNDGMRTHKLRVTNCRF